MQNHFRIKIMLALLAAIAISVEFIGVTCSPFAGLSKEDIRQVELTFGDYKPALLDAEDTDAAIKALLCLRIGRFDQAYEDLTGTSPDVFQFALGSGKTVQIQPAGSYVLIDGIGYRADPAGTFRFSEIVMRSAGKYPREAGL